jgi:hypothetical protein
MGGVQANHELAALRVLGLLLFRARKGRTWLLSAATDRRLGERVTSVRQRGSAPLQQEQMMPQYVGNHG